jgi:RecA-family ATPase
MQEEEEEETFPRSGKLLSRDQLSALPKPEPLISDWLDQSTTVLLVGDTGTNKTFLMLGWACCAATGKPWLGNDLEISTTVIGAGETQG